MGLFADLMYDDEDPKNVAKEAADAYSLMNEQLKRKEGANEDAAWDKTFQSLEQRGFSPSAALIPQAADVRPGQEQGIGPAPGTGQGSGYQEPDPLQRWKSQVDAMVNSGNPTLQKEGLAQLSAYRARATSPVTPKDTRTSGAKYADELGLTGQARMDFIERYASKQQYAPKLTTVSDAKSLQVMPGQEEAFKEKFGRDNVGVGMEVAEIAPFVNPVDPAEIAKENKAGTVVGEFENLLFGEGGLYTGKEGKGILGVYGDALNATIQQYTQQNPKYKQYEDIRKGSLANIIRGMGETGNLAVEDIARGERLIPTTQLPFPDSAEVARLKVDSLKRMLGGDPSEMLKIIEETETAIAKAKAAEGKDKPVGATWEDADYMYRKAPDGSIQRRAK